MKYVILFMIGDNMEKDRKLEKDRKNYIIIFLCIVAIFMVTGFSTFAQFIAGQKELEVASTDANWDVGFESAKVISSKGGTVSNLTHSNSIAHFNTQINSIDGYFEIEFIVKNRGNLNARVNDIYIVPKYTEDDIIVKTFDGIYIGDIIKPGETQKLIMTIKYNKNAKNTNLNDLLASQLIIDYVQA